MLGTICRPAAPTEELIRPPPMPPLASRSAPCTAPVPSSYAGILHEPLTVTREMSRPAAISHHTYRNFHHLQKKERCHPEAIRRRSPGGAQRFHPAGCWYAWGRVCGQGVGRFFVFNSRRRPPLSSSIRSRAECTAPVPSSFVGIARGRVIARRR